MFYNKLESNSFETIITLLPAIKSKSSPEKVIYPPRGIDLEKYLSIIVFSTYYLIIFTNIILA